MLNPFFKLKIDVSVSILMMENCTSSLSDVRDTSKFFLVQCVNNSNLGIVGLIWLLREATTKNN